MSFEAFDGQGRRREAHMNDELVVVLPRLLDLENDQDHLLQPVSELEPVERSRKRLESEFSDESSKKGRRGESS